MPCIDFTDLMDYLPRDWPLDRMDEWLSTPHPGLGGITPNAAIAAGRASEVKFVAARERES